MKFIQSILLLFSVINIYSQYDIDSALIGKVLVDDNFDYLEFISDSLLVSSLNDYDDTAIYKVSGDVLITIEDYTWYGPNDSEGYRIHNKKYQISQLKSDTIVIISPQSTLHTFRNIESLKVPVSSFEFLELDFITPWDDNRFIRIDNSGKYYEKRVYNPIARKRFLRKKKISKWKLDSREMQLLFMVLTEYCANKLPRERSCPIDGAQSNFKISYNGELIESEGCTLSWIHSKFLDYLLSINEDEED